MLGDEARLKEQEIRIKQRRRCVVYRQLRDKKSACLVSGPSCFCYAYPLGQSFDHVVTPPLNYQSASLCLKPPINMVWDYCGLVLLAEAGLGVEAANLPLHHVNTFAMSLILLV